jgi:hypothetical protein
MNPKWSSAAMLKRAVPARLLAAGAWFISEAGARQSPTEADALSAFDVVRSVFQHPRCQNCHIPGDSPLQSDAGLTHSHNLVRGADGPEELQGTTPKLIRPGMGILAADESLPTIANRSLPLGIANTDENRRFYSSLLFTAPAAEKFITGVNLFEETTALC